MTEPQPLMVQHTFHPGGIIKGGDRVVRMHIDEVGPIIPLYKAP